MKVFISVVYGDPVESNNVDRTVVEDGVYHIFHINGDVERIPISNIRYILEEKDTEKDKKK